MRKSFHEVLAPLLVGFTVTEVEHGLGCEGDPARITCVNGNVTRSFEVWGGIYGPVVSHLQDSTGVGPALWKDVEQMFSNITDYVTGQCDAPITIVSVDDPLSRGLGFRCLETGVEWWLGLVTAKESKFAKRFSTPDSRKALAVCLTNCGMGLYTDIG